MVTNILLSGGWGYGNLGDDALLEASVNILREKYASSQITVMTYNPSDSIVNGCRVVPSMHRTIYGKRAFKFLRIYGKSWNYDNYPRLVARIINKLERIIEPYRKKSDMLLEQFRKDDVKLDEFRKLFSEADIFVMSGGGYFNSWEDSFNSRYMELLLAKEVGTPAYIMGQTIGPLTKEQTERIRPLMQGVKGIYVRDDESEKDLMAMGCYPVVAPDMVLSYVGNDELKDSICVIPAEYPAAVRTELVDAVAIIGKETGMPIILTATRLYNRDINCLKEIYAKLKSKCLNVQMVIPKNYEEVKATIKGNRYVISRNLHGLILGWREGAKCLCLCGERKFVSFMKQIGREDCIVNVDKSKAADIKHMFDKLMFLKEDHIQKQRTIADEVLSACNNILI